MATSDEEKGDELLKRLWDMPPKTQEKITGKKRKTKKKKKAAR